MTTDLEALDGALMVMIDPNHGEALVVWFGGDTLRYFDNELRCTDIRSISETIENAQQARAEAEEWFNDLY